MQILSKISESLNGQRVGEREERDVEIEIETDREKEDIHKNSQRSWHR